MATPMLTEDQRTFDKLSELSELPAEQKDE